MNMLSAIPRRHTLASLLVFLAGMWAAVAPPQALAQETLKLGVIGPFSGPSADFGTPMLNGVQLAVEEINAVGGYLGRKIELVVEDDRCNANDLLAAVKKLTEQDKVFALNGGSCSGAVVGARVLLDSRDARFAPGDAIVYQACDDAALAERDPLEEELEPCGETQEEPRAYLVVVDVGANLRVAVDAPERGAAKEPPRGVHRERVEQ